MRKSNFKKNLVADDETDQSYDGQQHEEPFDNGFFKLGSGNEFTFENYTKGITSEPSTYSILLKKIKSKLNDIDLINDPHTVIKDSDLVVKQLFKHITNKGYKLDKIKLMDVGCGLGFITDKVAKIVGYENVYCCDPSPSSKDFINLQFPKLNFIHCDTETIPKKFYGHFDVVYLREVYPFTRTNNLEIHKKILESLFKLIKFDGVVVLDQIKSEKNIFNNLSKLNYNYDIKLLIPHRLLRNIFIIFLNKISYSLSNLLLKILFKIFRKKSRYYISFKKV